MTAMCTGGDVSVGDKIIVTRRCVFTVTDIDPNDGHVYLFTVAESSVLLGIGIAQTIEIIPRIEETP